MLLPIILIALTWRFFKKLAFKSRGLLRYWKIIPLVLAMLLISSGIAHAGVIECGVIQTPFWWADVIRLIILVIAILM